MDIESCESILNLLKSFANDYKINIFVVHHAILNQELFDRILQINKDVFTSINEVSVDDDQYESDKIRLGHYTVV
jgi:ABC-type Mn2+/Zn2+ transport system ATPase subunit